jgi:hypothetical protein
MIWVINCSTFETGIDTNMKQLNNGKELIKFSLATLIVTSQPWVGFISLTKENGVSGIRVTRIWQAWPIPWSPRSPDFTLCDLHTWGRVRGQVHHPPMSEYFRELDTEFHRPQPMLMSNSCGVYGKNSNIALIIVEKIMEYISNVSG